jgi:hypothetical protein
MDHYGAGLTMFFSTESNPHSEHRPIIYESDVDGVLAEEFLSNPVFAQSFARAVAAQTDAIFVFDQVQVTRQVRHRSVSGTADLVVDLLEGRSPAARLLIENKLEAGFASDQPRRYAASKRGFLAAQIAPVVVTVLVCPATYRAASRGAAGFEAVLTYEEIVRWLDPAGQRVLSAALRRASLPYEAEDAPEVSSFFEGYRRLAAATAPELVVKPNPNSNNARPRGSGRCISQPIAS